MGNPYVVCNQDGCPHQGLVLPLNMPWPDGEQVFCGGCGTPVVETTEPPASA